MRKILGFGAVLTAACLSGTMGTAYGQGGGPATVGGRIGTTTSSSLVTAPNNLEQKANEQAEANQTPAANTAVPGVTTAAPGGQATVPNANTGAGVNTAVPGSTLTPASTAGVGGNTAAPTNYQGPGTAGNPVNQATSRYVAPGVATGTVVNQPGNTVVAPATPTAGMPNQPSATTAGTAIAPGTPATGTAYNPGLANPGEWNYRSNAAGTYAPTAAQGIYPGTATAATPGYTNRVMPGMGGYNSVNPMATTMAPGYYYAGTAGMPYATYNQGYSGTSPYGYGPTTAYPGTYMSPGYNATGYTVQRRGLFGRRNRIVYPASPYRYSTYGTTTYSNYPGTSGYGTTTYYSAPTTYTYGTYPY